MTDESLIEKYINMYSAAAELLNGFFARRIGRRCADCLAFHKKSAPEDPIAAHELVEGFFPGCCQEGAAESAHIPGVPDGRLPEEFFAALKARRPPPPGGQPPAYAVITPADGKIHRGRGCLWLGEKGCALGPLKSPICVTYLCPPLIDELSRSAGRPLSEELKIIGETFGVLARSFSMDDAGLGDAEKSLQDLKRRLEELEADLGRETGL